MRYHRSRQYLHANPEDMKQFIGLKSKKYDGRLFVIDERDARMIVANLPKKDYAKFKKIFKENNNSSFRVLQDIEYDKNHRKLGAVS